MSRRVSDDESKFRPLEREFGASHRASAQDIDYAKQAASWIINNPPAKVVGKIRMQAFPECLDMAWEEGKSTFGQRVYYHVGFKQFKAEVNAVLNHVGRLDEEIQSRDVRLGLSGGQEDPPIFYD